MKLTEEQKEFKDGLIKQYRGQMIEAIEKEIGGHNALNDLLQERAAIREKISSLQQQADGLNVEIEQISEEIRSHEEKTTDALQNAKRPSFSQKAREKQANLSDLQKWQKEIAKQIQELEDSIGKNSPLTEKLSIEWHRNMVIAKEPWDEKINEHLMAIESIFEAWFDAIADCERTHEIPRRGRPPQPIIPYSRFVREKMRPTF